MNNFMSKSTVMFSCSKCDAQFSKWTGRCLECGGWGTIGESTMTKEQRTNDKAQTNHAPVKTISLGDIKNTNLIRLATNNREIDRVLGGPENGAGPSGIVPGSLILLGGEPGIGKSTLALQLAFSISNTLYFSGEESIAQIKLRADRLTLNKEQGTKNKEQTRNDKNDLRFAIETDVDAICATIGASKPALAIIDSIQTVYTNDTSGEPGSVTQIRASAAKLLTVAKSIGTAIIIIGHVTKDGTVAGPKTLEHLVDTVLYFEGERHGLYRILRSVKNRFGGTDEVGIFSMSEHGLAEVNNPSASFLSERTDNISGSVVTCLMEGTRPLLVEIQALVNKTSFGYPVRKASGFDLNRLHVLVAVMQKRAGINLAQADIHINVVGGLEANEPAADLAVIMAIASSVNNKPLGQNVAVFGEVGLGGEIRRVAHSDKRQKECQQLGFKNLIIGGETMKNIKEIEKA